MAKSRNWTGTMACACIAAALASCETTDSVEATADAQNPPVDLAYLLSMDFGEAAEMSPQKTDLAPFYRVAASSIEVLSKYKDGTPKKIRARGKVFVDMLFREPAKALCQEAIIGDDEVILRGRPAMQRGGSIVEGLEESTVFYMVNTRLRVLGDHRLTNPGQIVEKRRRTPMPAIATLTKLPDYGPWEGGPNPLLPPLTPAVVPDKVRQELYQLMRASEAEDVLQRNRREAEQQAKEKPQDEEAAATAKPEKPKSKPDPDKNEQ